MTQVTIRNVDEDWVKRAKEIAAEQGKSMNSVLRNILAESLAEYGVADKPKTNGLEKFAGMCPDGFGKEFDEAMEDCSRIDEEDWK